MRCHNNVKWSHCSERAENMLSNSLSHILEMHEYLQEDIPLAYFFNCVFRLQVPNIRHLVKYNFREYHSKTSFLTVCSFSPANLTFIHESYGMLITISGLVPLLLQQIINLIKLDTSNTTKFILNHCLHYT